jgi:hypothetical protein
MRDKYSQYRSKKIDKKNRRIFLKKLVWSVPNIYVLGQIIKPDYIYADSGVDGTPNDGWNP